MTPTLTLTTDMTLVLGLVGMTMLLFLFDRIRPDVVALVVLVLLGLTGLVAPEDLFAGFAGNAVISIIATMILGAGLERTGALNRLAGWLLRRGEGSERKLLFLTSATAGLTSSIMQNPAVMALYMPVASRLSARTGVALSRLLLPIAAAIVMGGGLTMVGNSPLILLNDLLVSANANLPSGAVTLKQLGMFAPLPIGLALLAATLLYFHFRQKHLHQGEDSTTPAQTRNYFAQAYGIDGQIHEMTVRHDSPLIGLTLGEVEALPGAPTVLALKSGEESRLAPPADARIWAGDVLGVMGEPAPLAAFAQARQLALRNQLREFAEHFNPTRAGIAEAVIPPTSRFIGKTASELKLRKQYRLSLLALNRDQEVLRENVRDMPLKAGDMLVLHSVWRNLADTAAKKDFVIVTDFPKSEQRPQKFGLAMTIFAVSMLLALSSHIPVPIALMAGVAGMLVAGVIQMDEAYASINWKTVFMMACLIPLGWAMDSSGAAAWMAGHTINKIPAGTPLWLIEIALALLTVAFSLVVSHVGATIMMVPLAINLALAANGNPMVFALIVALSASNNFMTSTNPVISMVMAPGGYNARELWRIGLPLTGIYTLVIVLMVNLIW